jgi:hypothetical protein
MVFDFDNNIYSNMSFPQVMDFLSGVKEKISNTHTYGIDLSFYKYSKEELSESGGRINYLNTSVFDEEYRSVISQVIDKSLEKERVRIEIYNGSGVEGAAMQLGRKIENAGCDVVRYENAPNTQEKTSIYISDTSRFEKSLALVEEIMSGNYELHVGRPTFMTTGDIVVIMGEDIKAMYSF